MAKQEPNDDEFSRMSDPVNKEEKNVLKVERKMSPTANERQDSIKKETAEATDFYEEEKCRPLRKRRRVNGAKECQVCGGQAQAHFFGALACATCKAFFRRNGNKKEFKKCVFRGGCEINFQSRRFCSPCRLNKCFEVGMQADLIMDEKEKRELMQKVNENRCKKKKQNRDREFSSLADQSSKCMVPTKDLDLSTPQGLENVSSPQSSTGMAAKRINQWATTLSTEEDSTSRVQVDISAPSSSSSRGKQPITLQRAACQPQNSPAVPGEEGVPGIRTVLSLPHPQSKVAKLTTESTSTRTSVPCYSVDLPLPPTPPTPLTPTILHMWQQQQSSTMQSPSVSLKSTSKIAPRVESVPSPSFVPPTFIAQTLSPAQSLPSPSFVPPTSTKQTVPTAQSLPSPSFVPPTFIAQTLSPAQSLPSPSFVPPTSTAQTAPTVESLPSPSPALVSQARVLGSFQHVPQHVLPSNPHMYWQLSPEERELLTGLSSLYQDTVLSILLTPLPTHLASSESITAEAYLKEREREAHHVIAFAKRLEDFRQLPTEVQISLLKASTDQVLGIRSCALFITERNAWLTRMGYVTLEHVRKLVPNHPYKDLSIGFCRNLKSLVKNDNNLYALLHCIILFDPSDERIINRQEVNMIRDKYIILLRHYLQSVYSYGHSEKYLMALQENLIFYRSLRREAKPLFKKFFPNIPSKLLVELMDLN